MVPVDTVSSVVDPSVPLTSFVVGSLFGWTKLLCSPVLRVTQVTENILSLYMSFSRGLGVQLSSRPRGSLTESLA